MTDHLVAMAPNEILRDWTPGGSSPRSTVHQFCSPDFRRAERTDARSRINRSATPCVLHSSISSSPWSREELRLSLM